MLTLHIESKVSVSSGGELSPDHNPEVTFSAFTTTSNNNDNSNLRGRSGSRLDRDRVHASSAVVRSELRLGKIHLVDLAGSERLSESKAQGDIMTETQNINKSLLALGKLLLLYGKFKST